MDQVAGLGCNQTDLILCLTTSLFINSSSVALSAYSVPGSVPQGTAYKKLNDIVSSLKELTGHWERQTEAYHVVYPRVLQEHRARLLDLTWGHGTQFGVAAT